MNCGRAAEMRMSLLYKPKSRIVQRKILNLAHDFLAAKKSATVQELTAKYVKLTLVHSVVRIKSVVELRCDILEQELLIVYAIVACSSLSVCHSKVVVCHKPCHVCAVVAGHNDHLSSAQSTHHQSFIFDHFERQKIFCC